jgi:hypothetical protein
MEKSPKKSGFDRELIIILVSLAALAVAISMNFR